MYIVSIISDRQVTLTYQIIGSIARLEIIEVSFTAKSSDCAKIIATFPIACYSSLVTVACTGVPVLLFFTVQFELASVMKFFRHCLST